jgi:hypothetical protein
MEFTVKALIARIVAALSTREDKSIVWSNAPYVGK